MDDLLHLDGDVFQEDESLADRMRRQVPNFDMTNASLTAMCGTSLVSTHSRDDKASPHETTMFNIFVTLINIPDHDYVRPDHIFARKYCKLIRIIRFATLLPQQPHDPQTTSFSPRPPIHPSNAHTQLSGQSGPNCSTSSSESPPNTPLCNN